MTDEIDCPCGGIVSYRLEGQSGVAVARCGDCADDIRERYEERFDPDNLTVTSLYGGEA